MKFIIMSREQVEDYEYTEPHINISINSPEDPIANLSTKATGRRAALFVDFHDIDDKELEGCPILMGGIVVKEEPGMKPTKRVKCIKPEQAKMIISFFNLWKDKVDLVVVNCFAGISRSSATAAALSIISGGTDEFVFSNKKYHPNMLVYRTILNESQYER